jgi:CBS domain-containing protein
MKSLSKREVIMAIGEICSREVVFVKRDATVRTAARLMREYHVGSLVVADETDGKRRPAGIVTDRDVVVAVVAMGLDPEVIQVGDIMGAGLVSVPEDWSITECVELMKLKGFRRLVVTDSDGYLVGVASADDVLSLLAEEISSLSSMVGRERKREMEARKVMV